MTASIFFLLTLTIHGSTPMTVPAGRFITEQQCQAIGLQTISSIEKTAKESGVADLRVTFTCNKTQN
jgi:hypothetical protein